MNDQALAESAHRAAIARLMHYGSAPGCEVRHGDGWVAVRTGAHSNDMNGVVSQVGAVISPDTAAEVIRWFDRTPASWLVARPERRLTEVLIAAGARPERHGRWSGGPLPDTISVTSDALPMTSGASPDLTARQVTVQQVTVPQVTWQQVTVPQVTVQQVTEGDQLDTWLDLATACEWIDGPGDRQARRAMYGAVGLGGSGPLRHWLALVDDEPVGFATSYLVGETADLCNLGVLGRWRRRGVGRALVMARLADAVRSGATTVVSAPSPDGWQLQRTLGFRNVPVIADTCFYLPQAQ